MEKQWLKVLDIIKDHVSSANFRIWFAQTSFDSYSGNILSVNVLSAFVKDQLAVKYQSIIKSAVQSVYGSTTQVEFKVAPSKIKREHPQEDEQVDFQFSPQILSPAASGLNPKYTLENFMVGLSNNLAYAAAQAVIQNPSTTYNPLFIYGGTGVGKTHLMQAIGNTLLTKNSQLKIIYCSSEKFTNDFVESIQTKRTGDFRSKYRSCNLLLIDDIQFISGRDSTQEEFFHTFNELQSKNCQIILTSDRPPNEMQKLESRLMSRFQGGLMVDIQLPDFDTRVAILKARCQEQGELLDEACLTLIAETTETNARELEGKLIQIIQAAKHQNQPFTTETIRAYLGRPQSNTKITDHKKVLTGINEYFNIKMSDLTGPRRKKELVLPRQIAMYVLYEDCNMAYEKIGQILGGRDHTTIMHGVEKISKMSSRDRDIQRTIIEIKQNLTS